MPASAIGMLLPAAPPRLLPPTMCDFASLHYWEERYTAAPSQSEEWLVPYGGPLAALLAAELGDLRAEPLLEMGCGNSRLSEQLVADGWSCVTACDISRAAVALARAQCSVRPPPAFCVADARALTSAFAEGSFAAVIDKGTLDAICCGDGWDYEAGRVAESLCRVLRPGGVWVGIALTPPAALLPAMANTKWESLSGERWGGSGGSVLYRYLGQTCS